MENWDKEKDGEKYCEEGREGEREGEAGRQAGQQAGRNRVNYGNNMKNSILCFNVRSALEEK